METFFKKNKYLLSSLLIVFVVFSYYILFNHSIFVFAGDGYEQLYKFYVEAWMRIRRGSLPLWDWSNFMGNNYYGMATYYFIGSPFFWLTMCLPSVEYIKYSFLYSIIAQEMLCVYFGYLWLNKVTGDKLAASVGGLVIAFCGSAFSYYPDGFLFAPITFVPLLLYFSERYLSNESGVIGIVLSVAIIGIVNYYTLYLIVPFVCIYTLIRYFVVNDKVTVKGTFTDGFNYVLRILLGVGASSFVLLPSFMALNGNPKVGESFLNLSRVSFLTYYRFLTSFFTPVCDWRNNINYFVSIEVDGGVSFGGGFANYSLIISLFCLAMSFFVPNKKERNSIFAFVAIYCVFAFFPAFYILFNRNYETRWMVNYSFILSYVVAIVLSKRAVLTKKHILMSAIGLSLVAVTLTFFSIYRNLAVNEWEIEHLIKNCIFVIFAVAMYCVALTGTKRSGVFIYAILFLEVIYCFYGTFISKDPFNSPMTFEQFMKYENEYKGAAKKIIEIDNGFYRIDKDESYSGLGGNDSHLQGYKSYYGYSSVYDFRMIDFIKGRFSYNCMFFPQTGKDIIKNITGSKYWFSYKDSKDQNVPYGYEFLCSTEDGADIYLNRKPISFAYLRNKTISKEDFDKLTILEQDYLLLDHIVLDDCDESDSNVVIQLEKLKPFDVAAEYIDLSDKYGYLYIEYKDSIYDEPSYTRPVWSVVHDDGTVSKQKALKNELGYIGISITDDDVGLDIVHDYSTSIYYDSMDWYDDWYDNQVMVDGESVNWDDNSISGTISLEEDGFIATIVPFDAGWTVKSDGKKIDALKVNNGFVGFYLTSGEHLIEMTYFPPGLAVGMIAAFASLLVTVVWDKKAKTGIG